VGISIGSIFGGDFIKHGRRQALIRFNFVGLFGSLISFYLNFWSMCFGRLVLGFSSGVMLCTTPKMLEETIPSHLFDRGFGTSTSIFVNLAFFGVLLVSGGMPEEPKDLADSKFWMVIFGIQIPF